MALSRLADIAGVPVSGKTLRHVQRYVNMVAGTEIANTCMYMRIKQDLEANAWPPCTIAAINAQEAEAMYFFIWDLERDVTSFFVAKTSKESVLERRFPL